MFVGEVTLLKEKELTAGDHDYFTIAIKRWEKKDLYYYNTAAVIDAPISNTDQQGLLQKNEWFEMKRNELWQVESKQVMIRIVSTQYGFVYLKSWAK